MDSQPTIGDELKGSTFRFVGFTFGPHPSDRRSKILVAIYSIMPDESEHVICTSCIQQRRVKDQRRRLSNSLGSVFDEKAESEVIPYAAQILQGDFAAIKTAAETGWPGIVWSWLRS